MYYSNNVQVSNSQASTSPLPDSSTILSSVNIYEKFPFLNELKFEKYRQMYYQNVDTTGRLSIQTTYELFSYLNLPSKVLEHTWSLCDVHAAEFLSLPEFLLFIYFLDLYLSSYELPTTLPTNLRQEVQLAEEKLGEGLVGNSPTDDTTSKSFLPTPRVTQSRVLGEEEKEKLNLVSVVTEPPAKMADWLSPNKEPPDCSSPLTEENLSKNRSNLTTGREPFPVDPSVNSSTVIDMLTQKINTKREILERLLIDSQSKQHEWDSIEQLKARIKVIQNEINSVEESQPEIDFDKLITQMIHFSEQRSQSEMEFEERVSELNSLSSKARDLNEKLALARLKLFHTKDSKEFKTSTPEMNELSRAFSTSNPINGMVDEQARLKQKAAEMLAQRMQAVTITLSNNDPASIEAQVRLDAEKARIEQEKRRSLKEIELIERKVHRMNTRLERGEPSIHTYSKILMGNRSTSESKPEYLDGFMEELKNSKSRPPMSKKSIVTCQG
ncbi:actin organization and endocytosis protein, partial [Basidiobolus ranarum]